MGIKDYILETTYSFSDIYNPFTRFGFAAFGNNYLDNQATRQYRGPFSLPGLSYTADRVVIAQRFAKALQNWLFRHGVSGKWVGSISLSTGSNLPFFLP